MPTVNGHDVPSVIPPNQILVYFPQGILGLQKLEEPDSPATANSQFERFVRVPVYLSEDGSLKLDQEGEYVLPSITSNIAPVVNQALTTVGRTVSTVLLGEEPHLGRPRTSFVDIRDDLRDVRRSAGHSRQSSGLSVADMVRQVTSNSYDGPGGQSAPHPRSRPRGGMLFDSVGDLVPDHASHLESERFQLERKRMLGLYLTIHITLFVLWSFAAALDQWVSCDCIELGPWRTCTSCGVNGTKNNPSTNSSVSQYVYYKPDDICGDSSNFSQCDSPSFQTIVTLSTISIILFGFNIVIVLVDLVCHITPKRPFYPVFFLLIWSMSFATWLMMTLGEASPAIYNLTKLNCEAQANAASLILGKSGILVSHPLDPQELTAAQLKGLGATATATLNLAQGCTYGPSLLIAASSWGLYTIVCFVYFYRRYASWNSITNQLMRRTPHVHGMGPLPRPLTHRRRTSGGALGPSPSSGEFGQEDSSTVEMAPQESPQSRTAPGTPQRPRQGHEPVVASETSPQQQNAGTEPRVVIVDGDASHFRAAVAAGSAAMQTPPRVPRPKPSQAATVASNSNATEASEASPAVSVAPNSTPAFPTASPGSSGGRRRTTSLISPARDD